MGRVLTNNMDWIRIVDLWKSIAAAIQFNLRLLYLEFFTMKYIINFFKSKYLIALAAFCGWLFFYDKNDVPSQIGRRQELQQLNARVKYYKEQIKLTGDELNSLQSDPAALEKYAREKYFMKRDNEEVFIIE